MTVRVETEKELADAIKQGEDTIEITGNLANKTIKIRATGRVAWVIAFGAIGVAAYAAIATIPTGGAAAPIAGITALGAVGILGGVTTASAIAIAVAAGGVGVLTKLRTYKEVSRSDGVLILKRA
jgi:hypothetical protein